MQAENKKIKRDEVELCGKKGKGVPKNKKAKVMKKVYGRKCEDVDDEDLDGYFQQTVRCSLWEVILAAKLLKNATGIKFKREVLVVFLTGC